MEHGFLLQNLKALNPNPKRQNFRSCLNTAFNIGPTSEDLWSNCQALYAIDSQQSGSESTPVISHYQKTLRLNRNKPKAYRKPKSSKAISPETPHLNNPNRCIPFNHGTQTFS